MLTSPLLVLGGSSASAGPATVTVALSIRTVGAFSRRGQAPATPASLATALELFLHVSPDGTVQVEWNHSGLRDIPYEHDRACMPVIPVSYAVHQWF